MQRISVHIPDETKLIISLAAKAKNITESEIIRNALNKGLRSNHAGSNAQSLLNLAKKAEKIPTLPGKNPTDVSVNLDFYAWGGEKRKK